jgi:hypothetical protein
MVMALSSYLIAGFPPQERDADTGASACVLGTVWGTASIAELGGLSQRRACQSGCHRASLRPKHALMPEGAQRDVWTTQEHPASYD